MLCSYILLYLYLTSSDSFALVYAIFPNLAYATFPEAYKSCTKATDAKGNKTPTVGDFYLPAVTF